MFIRSVTVRGLRDLPAHSIDGLPRRAVLVGPDPRSVALFDAVELAFRYLAARPVEPGLHRAGVCAAPLGPDDESPTPEEVGPLDPEGLRAWLAPDSLSLTVEAVVELDPLLHARLRSLAAAEPRVAVALARDPALRVVVGAAATTDQTLLALSLQAFEIGEESFHQAGVERPRWQRSFLRALGARVHRFRADDLRLEPLLRAASGRESFAAYARWSESLGPDGPRLRVAAGPAGLPMLLGDGLPLRRHGEAALRRAMLAAAAHLHHADVLLTELDDPLLDRLLEGEGAPLEQCISARPEGALRMEAEPPTPGHRQGKALSFSRSAP